MASKSNIRSIRFTDELYSLIEAQEGNTFTEKLERLVNTCVKELPKKQKELKDTQEAIEKARKDLMLIRQRKQKFETNLRDINYAIENATFQVKRCTKAFEEIEE